jgi:hypothetical protein
MKPRSIALFFAIVIAALAAISFVYPAQGVSVASHTWYLPSITQLAKGGQMEEFDIAAPNGEEIPPEVAGLTDSLDFLRHFVDTSDLRFWLPDSHYFDPFWRQAEVAAQQGHIVRILHYGDSQIEMDRMTDRLRSYMQQTFGGGGPGMIPFRYIYGTQTIRQSTSGAITHLSSFGDSTVHRSKGNYGPMMQCFRIGGSATTKIEVSKRGKQYPRMSQFSRIVLLYNNNGDTLRTVFAHSDSVSDTLYATGRGVGRLVLHSQNPLSSFSLKVTGQADVYGITLDDGPGVAVDNIPMRGCSGQQFTTVSSDILSTAYSHLDVGLIILQFGGNAIPYLKSARSISSYCQEMGRQIDYLHRCHPGARILFIGPSDMSIRDSGSLASYPMIPQVVDSLIATVNAHNAAYWSIFHAMGGSGAMIYWESKGLAGTDYTHFTQRGADLMGDRLVQAFSDNYRLYCLEKRLRSDFTGLILN